MTDPNPDLPPAVRPAAAAPKKSGGVSALVVVVPLLALAAGAGYYLFEQSQQVTPVDEFAVLKPFFAQLQDEFKPADGLAIDPATLVAKPPAAFRKADAIGFSVVGTSDEKRVADEQAEWKDLMAALEKATGKKVTYQADVGSPDGQMEALKEGKLHVTAFNTGAVPEAVNRAGFVPLFCPADAAGATGYVMEVLVRPDSPVQKIDDLRGKAVGFVSLSSNSGSRAPMHLFHEKFGLLPGRDYRYRMTGGHETSIAELVYDTAFDAVCVAGDLHARAVAAGTVRFRGQDKPLTAAQTRTVFTSESFPPLCFGVAHDLPPDLRAAVEKVFAGYQFANSSAAKSAKQGLVKFAKADYAKDWKFVRDIDMALAKLADGR